MAEHDDELLPSVLPGDTPAPLGVAHMISALALNFALKYHNITTVQEGALRESLKRDGINLQPLHLDYVLETARRFELHMMASSARIGALIVETLEHAAYTDEELASGLPSGVSLDGDAMDEAMRKVLDDEE